MSRRIVAGLLVGGMLAAGVQQAEAATPRKAAATNPRANCLQADLQYVTDDVRVRLLALGWHGIAGDHAERLWSPACPVTLTPLQPNAAG